MATILRAIKILLEISGFASHNPGSLGSDGMESLMIIKLAVSNSEKPIPAIAADRGVLSLILERVISSAIAFPW